MKYFLTGGTGFLGRQVAHQLIDRGHQVNALVRSPARGADLAAMGAALFPGDVTDPASLRPPMAGVDGVFHVAGWYRVGVRGAAAAREAEAANVQGTRHVLEAMRALGVPKGVYTSSLVVFSDTHGRTPDESYRFTGRHLSVYDRTKAEAHDVALEFIRQGLPLVILQPGVIYGPGDTSSLRRTIRLYLRRRLPLIPARTAYCWAHVDDVARAHLLAMEKGRPGETYIVAGPCHTLVEFFALAEEITGVPAPRLRAPTGLVRLTAALSGVVEKLIPLPETYSAEYLRENGGTTYLGDNAKARRELGYAPRSLREGMSETLRHEMELMRGER